MMNFVDLKAFKPDDQEIFDLRRKRFNLQMKVLGCIFAFGWSTCISGFLHLSPLTESLKVMEYPEDKPYIIWIVKSVAFMATFVSSSVAMASGLYFQNLIGFIAFEFKIFGISIEKLLGDIDEDLNEEKFGKIIKEIKEYLSYYQKLLK